MFGIEDYDLLQGINQPVLTWYAPEGRSEFLGPQLAQWIAKTANCLADITGEDNETSLFIALPSSWRTLVWWAAATMCGFTPSIGSSVSNRSGVNPHTSNSSGAHSPTPNSTSAHSPAAQADSARSEDAYQYALPQTIKDADVVVTSSAWQAQLITEQAPATMVLLQALGPLDWSWPGTLPEGSEDAIALVSSQPDALITAMAGLAEIHVDKTFDRNSPLKPAFLDPEDPNWFSTCTRAWRNHTRPIWVSPGTDLARAAKQEGLQPPLHQHYLKP
ncbi:MAG: hypothetical protein Q4P06_03820 [Actinomycetaceae bacterium]|nr:hypothetical protein [Actinomycetaceae bacterium]